MTSAELYAKAASLRQIANCLRQERETLETKCTFIRNEENRLEEQACELWEKGYALKFRKIGAA